MSASESHDGEMVEYAGSDAFQADMQILDMRKKSPFAINGRIDYDAYIEFVTQFNEFINHRPKSFRKIIDREMKL